MPDDYPSAGEPRLSCCRGRWRSLGEVRAAIAYGDDRKRSNIEIATWTRRAAFEHRAFAPIEVALPPLPDGHAASAWRARDGFALLAGLRWADGERLPVAWSVRFVRVWCGFGSMQTAAAALRALVAERVIVETELRRNMRLFLPGPLPPGDDGGDEGQPLTAPRRFDGRRDEEWDPDELAAAIVAEFDAVELDNGIGTDGVSLATDCWDRDRHAGREWRHATADRWQCSVCHLPAAGRDVVWRQRP